MKQTKRYLTGLLAVLMLIGSIHIEGMTIDISEENVDESISLEQVEIKDDTNFNVERDLDVFEDIPDNSISFEEIGLDSEKLYAISDSKELNENDLDDIEPSETDNWELELVFYDSTVNDGKTPLTEINWDASDGEYGEGESRVITVQINYRNTNCVKTYQPGELGIMIPNLAYNTDKNEDNSPYWKTTITIGANDSTHSGYDWDCVSKQADEIYLFKNANILEERSNFEGSIQIVYEIKPLNESPEKFEDECIHMLYSNLKAKIVVIGDIEEIQSNNWPDFINTSSSYYEIYKPGTDIIEIIFDELSQFNGKYNGLQFYNKNNENITKKICYLNEEYLSNGDIAKKTYYLFDDYLKIHAFSNYREIYRFHAIINSYNSIFESNTINLSYTRTYIHPWDRKAYKVYEKAEKVQSLDGLPNANDYIWVKYGFSTKPEQDNYFSTSYPKIGLVQYRNYGHALIKFKDEFPEYCIILDDNLNLINNNMVELNVDTYILSNSYSITYKYFYVGYPINVYNEENGNLNITNEVHLYGQYDDSNEYTKLDSTSVNINLDNFKFTYTGDLYGIYKSYQNANENLYYQAITGEKADNHNVATWGIKLNVIYIGNPITLKVGDDLLYKKSLNEYQKLNDEEYYWNKINFYNFKNGNETTIKEEKYDCELYVRYKNSNEYVLLEQFKNKNKTWTFTKEDGVVGYYFMIYNLEESISKSSNIITGSTVVETKTIDKTGTLYNFCYLQTFFKNDNGDFEFRNEKFILQNEPDINSYSNFITKEEIASFDRETYKHYMQRSYSSKNWFYHQVTQHKARFFTSKKFLPITQDEKNKKFLGSFYLNCHMNNEFSNSFVFEKNYKEDYNIECAIKGYKIYDLLPYGMEIESNEEQIKNSLYVTAGTNSTSFYDIDGNIINGGGNYSEHSAVKKYIGMDIDVFIKKNWNNTGRTMIEIIHTFENPIYIQASNANNEKFQYQINYSISYDSFLENGNTWINYCYVDKLDTQKVGVDYYDSFYGKQGQFVMDNGTLDSDAIDIDEDGDITEEFPYDKAQTTITSIVSTHQDVQKSVKTDKSNFSTGTVESSLDSEYQYRLRVRTGQNDVTNLIIYDSLEEYTQNPDGEFVPAYGDKDHWNGEFLGIDTSYAENKGYTVKTYYSENIQTGNLYDDSHHLNPDWKEYFNPVKPVYTNGLRIKFNENCKMYGSSDYIYIYYYKGGKYYRSQKLYSTSIVGKEIEIPSIDFYLYWHTSSTIKNYYGFSINSIEPILTENIFTSTVSYLPNDDMIKLDGNNYPESMHNPYNSGVTDTLWYYSGEKQILEEGYDVIDMSKVKSLAFEYLDADGNPAIIPANSLTYVLIRMKSPADETITSLAYNGCRTQWQALDEFSQPVGFITGINSNIVKVSLPNTKKGSYFVKHEYYYRDYKGDLILENTVSEELVSNIPVDTFIKAENQNHIEENNEKTYAFTEDTGDITIKEDEVQEIILKYVRDEEYSSYQIRHEYYVKDKDNNLIFENTVSEETVLNVVVGTVIKANDQNHIETNNNKQYTYIEDTGDITIEKNITKEITIKYIREQEYGSYIVKHEYYVKDFDGNLTLEDTVSEEVVPDIPVDTVIKAEDQNHIETNNDKQYTYTEDTGDTTIQKDKISEIIIKYIRDEEYTAELPEAGGEGNTWILYHIILFLLIGSSSFFIANKKRKDKEKFV